MNTVTPIDQHPQFCQALVLHQAGKLREAAMIYAGLLESYPQSVALLVNLGGLLVQARKYAEAVPLLTQATQLAPDQPDAASNLGTALRSLGRHDEALALLERVVALNPGHANAWCNLGLLQKQLGRHAEARANIDRALALDPGLVVAHWGRGLLLLLEGDYAQGWPLYEYRWQALLKGSKRVFAQPLLPCVDAAGDPASLAGKRVLLHAEQGFGDTLQFLRYVPLIEALGAEVILEVQSPLKSIAASLPGSRLTLVRGDALPDFDWHCPLMSLPWVLGVAEPLATPPYLAVDPLHRARWQQRLGARVAPRIGLVWSGRATHGNDRNRSLELARLAPLLELPFEFHSLQKEYRPGDAAMLAALPGLMRHEEALEDFADTAALIEELDLLVSVDTSVVHLAGALGRPVWVLLPHVPDWRWLLDRSDTPWYPSARLFRQTRPGDWDTPLAALVEALTSRFRDARS